MGTKQNFGMHLGNYGVVRMTVVVCDERCGACFASGVAVITGPSFMLEMGGTLLGILLPVSLW
jgi:hypothetical protein